MSESKPLVLVVSGLSGAGKSTALNALEDAGFFCIDNLPTPGVLTSLEALANEGFRRIALGIDVRVRSFIENSSSILDVIEASYGLRVLFLDAADEALLRRFSSTRRPHPLSTRTPRGRDRVTPALLDGIHIERELLTSLRARASVLVDTTELSVHQLRRSVLDLFGPGSDGRRMRVRLVSFGFKYGAPVDADITLDVRFLHNPFFVPELKPLSGLDKPVVDYVLGSEDAKGWLSKTRSLLDFCIPRYEREGKSYLTIAVGCTGGRHRSVALAVELAGQLRGKHELEFDEVHRDVTRASERPARDDSPTQGARES